MKDLHFNEGNPFASLQTTSERKSLLCQLSVKAKKVQEEIVEKLAEQGGDFIVPKVNDILLESYRSETHAEFKTYQDWKKTGKAVCKGAKAFVIWSRPKKHESTIEIGGEEVKEEYEFWAMAYLFSNAQVK